MKFSKPATDWEELRLELATATLNFAHNHWTRGGFSLWWTDIIFCVVVSLVPITMQCKGELLMLPIYLQGFLIGIAFVAPIGLQNIFLFNNALAERRSKALFIAAFVWIFDALLSLAGFFGMGAIISANFYVKAIIMGIGSVLVLYIGYTILRSALVQRKAMKMNGNDLATKPKLIQRALPAAIWMAFVVTWANPQAIVDVSMMLGASRATLADDQAVEFIIGVLTASATWFMVITTLVSVFKNKIGQRVNYWINLVSSVIVMLYAVSLFVKFINLW